MVIACPNCQRKYQIDTSRIPPTGTSFTCWSCRATVRVDAVGLATAQPPPPKDEPAAPAEPSVPEQPVASAPLTPESNIPLSAMRFFESLAAEASLNQKMADQSAPAAETPSTPEPVFAEPEPQAPPATSTSDLFAPPPVEPTTAEDGSSRVPNSTMDLLTGDDVLDLPPVVPASAPVEEGRVLDLPGIDGVEPAHEGDTLSFAPVAAEPPKPGATQIFASEPPVAPEPPVPPSISFEGLLPPEEPAAEAPRPPARPRPTPIPLPAQAQEPPAAPEPVRFRGGRPPVPEPPVFPPPPPPPPPALTFPPPPEPPYASIQPPDEGLNPFAVEPEVDVAPPRIAPGPLRMTPAEIAVAQPAAWVAPAVSPSVRQSSSPGKSRRYLALVAVAIIVVVIAFWQRTGLLGFLKKGSGTPPKTPPTTPQPQPQQTPAQLPVQSPAQQQTPPVAQNPPTPTPTEPKPEPPAQTAPPAGAGNFTIQVRASPNEADAQAAAKALSSAGAEAYVVRADLGKKGVWYRVRVGRFASREEASQAASKLRSSGRASDTIIVGYEAP